MKINIHDLEIKVDINTGLYQGDQRNGRIDWINGQLLKVATKSYAPLGSGNI